MLTTPVTYAEIELGAIAYNVRIIKHHIGPNTTLIAVVKANAYGHGAVEVAQTALHSGAEWLAVARIDEGLQLRAANLQAPILVMNYTLRDAIAAGVDHDLMLTVTDLVTAERIASHAQRQGKIARIHVKIDTGMGRYGLLPAEVVPFFDRIATLPNLEVVGLFSHFSVADLADKNYTWQQFTIFDETVKALSAAGYHIPVRHIANSAATLDLPDMHLDAVRIGIAMYGLRPNADLAPPLELKPALSLKSHVVRVRTLPVGSSISYGRTYITPREMPVALIPVGYGDGYHRLLSNRGAVLINGKRAPIVGRVCMDQFVVNISDVGPVELDDEVVLIGCSGEECITADEVAGWAETINYEVTTGLLPRVPRVFV